MLKLLLVGTGGFLGSVFRYTVSGMVYRYAAPSAVPLGTLAVNIAGCLLIGFISGLAETRQLFNPETRIFLLIGVMGGFTTYSTFGYETYNLIRDGQLLATFFNVGLHLLLGIFAVWAGIVLARLA